MFFRTQPKPRRPRPATLGLESLEQRLPLAGDVTVAFNNGTLTITGDAQGNQIWVSQRGDRTVVSPSPWEMNGETRLRFGAVVGLPRVQFGGVKTVVVDLRGGNDVLVMGGLPSDPLNFRALSVNLGAGNNSLSAQGMIVDQNVTVRAGDGADSIRFDQVTVQGSTSIQTGNGDSWVRVSRSWLISPLEVIGGRNNDWVDVHEVSASTLRVGTGDGYDTVGIESSAVDVRLEITTGAGHDRVGLGQLRGTGEFVVNTGDGNDVVGAGDWLPGPRSLTVNLGAGQNEAHFGSMVIGGPLTVTSGAGQDMIDLRSMNVHGRLMIDAGDGNNRVTVTQISALSIQITTGQGVDQVAVLFGRSTGEVRVRSGAGADEVAILGVEAGAIDVDLGAGNDVASLQWNAFGRRTRFDGGAGRDTMRYLTTEFATSYFTGFEVFEQIMI